VDADEKLMSAFRVVAAPGRINSRGDVADASARHGDEYFRDAQRRVEHNPLAPDCPNVGWYRRCFL